MSKPIYIYGAGGLGREVSALLRHLPEWSLEGFYDDKLARGTDCDGIACVGGLVELLASTTPVQLVLAFGDPATKLRMAGKLAINPHIDFPTLIHPRACLLNAASIELGEGCIITAGAVLTTHIRVGSHTLINLNVTIGHNTKIGTACSIMPGANLAGDVELEAGVLIGSGANILNKVKVGARSTVGAGAVVVRNVRSDKVVIGVPAKELTRG